MRKSHLEELGLIVIGFGSAVWLFIQDIAYLIPMMGIAGSILAYERRKFRRHLEDMEKEIVDTLPAMFDIDTNADELKIRAYASSVVRQTKEEYVE